MIYDATIEPVKNEDITDINISVMKETNIVIPLSLRQVPDPRCPAIAGTEARTHVLIETSNGAGVRLTSVAAAKAMIRGIEKSIELGWVK